MPILRPEKETNSIKRRPTLGVVAAVLTLVVSMAMIAPMPGHDNIQMIGRAFDSRNVVLTLAVSIGVGVLTLGISVVSLLKLRGKVSALSTMADEYRQLKDQLTHQAHHDALTGLPNRGLMGDRLRQVMASAKRGGERVGVLFVDLDRFKLINDTLGHESGDQLLQRVARRLQSALRESDTLARVGVDEFMVVLPDMKDAQDAVRVATRLLEVLKTPVQMEQRELFVAASVGISIFPDDGADADVLERNAEAAMLQAKGRGGNHFQCFVAAMNHQAMERLELEGQLRRALEQNEFELYYQPRIDRSGSVVGFEGLLRWHHPELGLVPPVRFIPIAEESGLIVSIGLWALQEGCRQNKLWQDSGHPPVRVAVNVSALQFRQPDFVEHVGRVLEQTGLEPRWLELEITESLLMHNTQDVAWKLSQLRALGCAVAIDDFGTGYSSLSYLQSLPIDTLKVDRCFVRELGSESAVKGDGQETAIIRAIISLGRSLKMCVVAEGVETEAQRQLLLQMGCDGLQGFLFSQPVPAREAEVMIRRTAAIA